MEAGGLALPANRPVPFLVKALAAAAVAPLVIPLTGGLPFYLLHERFYPSVWGLPAWQSIIGVSINCTMLGYFFTWLYALPIVFVLRLLKQYRLGLLLVAGMLPALTLPFWQAEWAIAVLPVALAGTSTAYAFWRLSNLRLIRTQAP